MIGLTDTVIPLCLPFIPSKKIELKSGAVYFMYLKIIQFTYMNETLLMRCLPQIYHSQYAFMFTDGKLKYSLPAFITIYFISSA